MGEGAGASREAAARRFERAIELNPTQGQVHSNRRLILLERAEHEAERGGDAQPWVDRALAVLARAVDLNPSLAAAHNNLGNAYKMQAEVRIDTGENPDVSLELTQAASGRAIDPTDAEFMVLRMVAARNSGDEAVRHLATEEALAALRSAEGLNPFYSTACVPPIAEAREILGAGSDHTDNSGTM